MLQSCAHCGVHHFIGAACPRCEGSRGPTAAALVLGLVLTGCDGGETGIAQAEYGVAVVDEDKDGWLNTEDCNDADPDVHPEATETAGDGVDSNCDGADDT